METELIPTICVLLGCIVGAFIAPSIWHVIDWWNNKMKWYRLKRDDPDAYQRHLQRLKDYDNLYR